MAESSIVKRIFSKIIGFLSISASVALLLSYLSPFVSPEIVWWFQLFGLAYPIILVCFITLLPIIFFIKRKRWWSMMIILIVGLPVHLRFISFGGDSKAEEDATTLKVTSFNVRGFDTYQWTHKDLPSAERAFLGFIKNKNADVLCFQEYTVDQRSTKHMQPSEIKTAGKFKFYAEQLTVQTIKLDFGISIYSKYPIIEKGVVGDKNELYSLYVDIKINNDTVRIYNTHLQSIRLQQDEYSLFDENAPSNKGLTKRVGGLLSKLKKAYPNRMKQAKNIVDHANSCPHSLLICGDFNEPPTSYIYGIFNEEYNDAFRSSCFGIGRTYAGKIPAGRIDYFFNSESLHPLSFSIDNNKAMSDHYPITVEFSVE